MKILFDEFFWSFHSFIIFFSLGLDDHLVFDLVLDSGSIFLPRFHNIGKYILFARLGQDVLRCVFHC